jgi:small subunit ribosomal protein S6
MEKNELMNKYELVLILDAKLNPEERDAICKQVVEGVNKQGAKVINSQVWIERQKLSFTIKKRDEGYYHLINFEGEGSVVKKIEADLRLNEKVLRFAIFHTETSLAAGAAK